MKTEDPQILFKDLCARLPYGVKVVAVNNDHNDDLDNYAEIYEEIDYINCRLNEILVNGYEFGIDHVKPCYFPIECLTKPITIASVNDGKPFVPIEELLKIKHADFYNEVIGTRYEDIVISKNHSVPSACFGLMATRGITVRTFPPEMPNNTPHYIIEKLNEWHINYRLPAHLFVPVTETFNPYAK